MHRIDDAIVRGGRIVLSDLPFAEGQRVRVIVAEHDAPAPQTLSIEDVRRQLRGGVVRFDDPFEPMIPADHWEMLR
jgi:hypothetical protein